MVIPKKRIGPPQKLVPVRRLGFPNLTKQAIHTLDVFFWAQQRALATINLKLSPLHVAILRRANRVRPIRFQDVVRWTKSSKTEMSRATKYLAELALIEISKASNDPRMRLIKLTLKGKRELKELDAAFEADLLELIRAAPFFYSTRRKRMARYLMRANVYLPSAGVADKNHVQAGVREDMPPAVANMSQEEFDLWKTRDARYASAGKCSQNSDSVGEDDEIPW